MMQPVGGQFVDYTDSDREFWEEELADFVPQRVFDAHCHLFDAAHMRPDAPTTTRSFADLETLRAWGRLMFPWQAHEFPPPGDAQGRH